MLGEVRPWLAVPSEKLAIPQENRMTAMAGSACAYACHPSCSGSAPPQSQPNPQQRLVHTPATCSAAGAPGGAVVSGKSDDLPAQARRAERAGKLNWPFPRLLLCWDVVLPACPPANKSTARGCVPGGSREASLPAAAASLQQVGQLHCSMHLNTQASAKPAERTACSTSTSASVSHALPKPACTSLPPIAPGRYLPSKPRPRPTAPPRCAPHWKRLWQLPPPVWSSCRSFERR